MEKINVGKRIYYDKITGEVILNTGDKQGVVIPMTAEQEIASYTALSERNRETFDVLELDYGEYARYFAETNGYRINPDTKQIEFSYPDPNEVEPSEPIYQEPLSAEVKLLKAKNQVLSEQVDFHEELIIELAMQIYE